MNKNGLVLLSLIALLANIPFAASARAVAGEKVGWAGALFGLSVPNADQTTARGIYGITAGAKLGDEYGIGAYYLTSRKDEDFSAGKSAFDYDLYGIELTYHFEGEAAGVYFGGRLGTSKVKTQTTSGSPTNFGAVIGVNKMLGDIFSLGGDLSYMSVGAGDGLGQFSMLNFMATLKLWF